MFCRLCARAPKMRRKRPLGFAPQRRNGDAQFAVEVARRERLAALQQFAARPGEEQVAAVFARARPQIDHVIGGCHGVGIVLDDQDGVAQIAQSS